MGLYGLSNFLKAGANVLLADSNGWTAVPLAVGENHVPIVVKLITQGANPMEKTALGRADYITTHPPSGPMKYYSTVFVGSN
jgi:ankyrin repeat protein